MQRSSQSVALTLSVLVATSVDEPLSMVTLLLEPGGLAGTVLFSGGSYRVKLIGDGLSAVQALAPRIRGDRVRIPPQNRGQSERSRPQTSASSRASVWDVLALWTPQAGKDNGGTRSTKADWKVATANYNTALTNTGIPTTVRLTGIKKWNSKKRGSDADFAEAQLDDLTNDKKVAKLRKRFGADIVASAIEINDIVCGLGWLSGAGSGVRPSDGDIAFHVNSVDCLAGFGGLTFAHEAGHNTGLNHDAANARGGAGSGAYAYSFGHRVAGEFSTVMAYACDPDGLASCPEIPFFSTPTFAFTATGSLIGVANQADNTRSLSNDAATVEDF